MFCRSIVGAQDYVLYDSGAAEIMTPQHFEDGARDLSSHILGMGSYVGTVLIEVGLGYAGACAHSLAERAHGDVHTYKRLGRRLPYQGPRRSKKVFDCSGRAAYRCARCAHGGEHGIVAGQE